MQQSDSILSKGLLLPLRAYFQPRQVLAETAMMSSAAQPVLIYLCSLLWVVGGALLGIAVFGMPAPDRLTFPIALPPLFALLGGLFGFRSQVRGSQTGQAYFNCVMASSFGVFLNVAFVVDTLMLEQISRSTGVSVAMVVDSPTLDYPTMFVMGAGLGFIISALLGSHGRWGLLIAYVGSAFFLVMMASGSNPAVRAPNVAAFATAALVATHIAFQPLYVLIAALSALLAELDPGASRWLWRISPAHWCDLAYVPLPGLSSLVTALYRQHSFEGMKAVQELKLHPFYSGIGKKLETQIGTGLV